MNLPRRIAARLATDRSAGSWSRPVVAIATAGVALGIALIILATAIVQGFQSEVRDLVIGFSAHLTIEGTDPAVPGLRTDVDWVDAVRAVPGVVAAQPYLVLPGLLETREEVVGIAAKGIGPEWARPGVEGALREGVWPGAADVDSLVVSRPVAERLKLAVGDRVRLYLVAGDDVRPEVLAVAGIYETGLLEYDREFIFVPYRKLQRAARTGVEAQPAVAGDTVAVRLFGSAAGRAEVRWEGPAGGPWTTWRGPGPHRLDGADTTARFRAIVRDERGTAGDTVAFAHRGGAWTGRGAGGGWRYHASGWEVLLDDAREVDAAEAAIYAAVPLGLTTSTFTDGAPELFAWLSMLDLNVEVIVGLMVLISIINMASALLVIILERTAMVGMLKAMGMRDGAVLRVFVWHAVRILGRGFLWGNVLGFGLAALQEATGVVRLDPEAYYVDRVPILIDGVRIAVTEVVAFAVCAVAMFLPAWAAARLSPVTAMRFR
jgi:lipoprotein-releasing system permease protein